MEKISGFIDHVIYRNAENGYTVFVLISGEEEVTCVGVIPVIHEGENVSIQGDLVDHPTYGTQMKINSMEACEPEDAISMERYLGSGAIKGIGAALAARIVRRFKKDTFRIIEQEPERLIEVRGISERKAREISDQVAGKKDLRQAMIFLQQYGINHSLAVKIYETYHQEIYRIVKENPYQLADDIQGIGFKIADEIAAKVGIHTDSDFRIRSGIQYTLLQASGEGHTYLPSDVLEKRTAELIGVDREYIKKHFMDLAIEKKIVIKQNNIYAASFYYLELNVAAMLRNLNLSFDIMDLEIDQKLLKIEKEIGMDPDEMQSKAVREAVKHGVMIITGGPGTGKTTTINTMIRFFMQEGLDILLAAPTGRAAKRMSETTGFEARTIHRMLELNGGIEGAEGFARTAENPLETDVIIIDEMSMVDISLMNALLKAVIPGTRIILVGDVNQLPSVGPGNVLQDIIDSNVFPVVRLNKIFRQATSSDIVVNAHKINKGESIVLDNKSRDFFFLKRYDADSITNVMVQLIAQKLPGYVKATSFDIQVLTPMRKGLLGVENLNQILQQYLNPKSKEKVEIEHGEGVFREGDKVMQTKNNYQLEWEITNRYRLTIDQGLGVFNGDMGIIREINRFSETMKVEFDEGRMVTYSLKGIEELELAYAITIHKSQGSEYPAVVIPLFGGPKMLMNRNLIYTAVTRAKSCVTLVGDEKIFQSMIENLTQRQRYCGLKDQICEYKNPMECD
ncbi:MAG: ATP-dependent RecD-like DNA helicase [Lachnospiraceae bacterium]